MIHRVLVAPLNYSHRQAGQIDAFQHVFGRDNVREFDFVAIHNQGDNPNARLLASALEFKPHWLWLQVQGADIIHGSTIERIREELPQCLVTHWMGDLRLEVGAGLADICRATHVTLLSNSDVRQHVMYQHAGARRVEYVQIGLDPEDLPQSRKPPDFFAMAAPTVVFCGGYYGQAPAFTMGTAQRLSAIRRLRDHGVDIGVFGSGWPADIRVIGHSHVKHQSLIYQAARVVLSINHFNDYANYYSDRHLIAMASGTPVVARYVPGLEREFDDGVDCMMWTTEDELVTRVTTLLDEPVYADAIGRVGQAKVLAHHTWRKRIEDLQHLATGWQEGL